ncbi:MAG: hypothetical protein AB1938_05495 [Myxococcota bacterium]
MHRTLPLALLLLGSACGPGSGTWTLEPLPSEGAPLSSATSATRLPSGAVFATAFDTLGTLLKPGASRWESFPSPLRAISLPQADGSVYAMGAPAAGFLFVVQGDELVQERGLPSPASMFVGKTSDGALWAVGEANGLFRGALGESGWQLKCAALVGEAGVGVMRAPGKQVLWKRAEGLVELDADTFQQTVLLPCTHPSMRGCAVEVHAVPGRHGELFFVNGNDTTFNEVELWRLDAGATEPVKVAGPELPELDKRTPDDLFNRYRPGPPQLYVDTKDRVWLAFRWGSNEADDVSYLYGWVGTGPWQLVSKNLPSNLALGGDGETPLIINNRYDAPFDVRRIIQ